MYGYNVNGGIKAATAATAATALYLGHTWPAYGLFLASFLLNAYKPFQRKVLERPAPPTPDQWPAEAPK